MILASCIHQNNFNMRVCLVSNRLQGIGKLWPVHTPDNDGYQGIIIDPQTPSPFHFLMKALFPGCPAHTTSHRQLTDPMRSWTTGWTTSQSSGSVLVIQFPAFPRSGMVYMALSGPEADFIQGANNHWPSVCLGVKRKHTTLLTLDACPPQILDSLRLNTPLPAHPAPTQTQQHSAGHWKTPPQSDRPPARRACPHASWP